MYFSGSDSQKGFILLFIQALLVQLIVLLMIYLSLRWMRSFAKVKWNSIVLGNSISGLAINYLI